MLTIFEKLVPRITSRSSVICTALQFRPCTPLSHHVSRVL